MHSKVLKELKKELEELADQKIAIVSQRFFKTGPGEYGEGDAFIGIRVPELRRLSKKYLILSNKDTVKLITSPVHEERLLALFILVLKYKKGSSGEQEAIFRLYIANMRYVNNWDLVDCSAEHIIGAYLIDRDKSLLYELTDSGLLWERRISVMSTFHFVKLNHYHDTLRIAEKLLSDREDLIHKAVGWMLREIGNRDIAVEQKFLKKYYNNMPRTMLRYAIEKFPEELRQDYLKGRIGSDYNC